MSKNSIPNARPVAPQVDPIVPERGNEQSAGGSTPRVQNTATLYPDGNASADKASIEAFKSDEVPTDRADDELLIKAPGRLATEEAVPGSDPSVLEMVTVRTTGNFQLMDPWTGTHIPFDQDATVPMTTFIQNKLDSKELEKA